MDVIALVRQLLEMGWPAIVLIQLWIMWKQYIDAAKADKEAYEKLLLQYIDDMRRVAGLKLDKLAASD